MGAPVKDMKAADESSAEALLTLLQTIDPAERRKHASVFNYWLSIRGTRQFPTIRDLDPLEISDAGPFSVLVEMIGAGEDAEIRHLGQAIKAGVEASRISDVPSPSLLACIHAKLPIVAASRQAFAFEDQFATDAGAQRCWVTLLPLSANGTWIDFVYGFVSLDDASAEAPEAANADQPDAPESAAQAPQDSKVELPPSDEIDPLDPALEPSSIVDEPSLDAVPLATEESVEIPEIEPQPVEFEPDPAPVAALEAGPAPEPDFGPERESESEPDHAAPTKAGFSAKLFEGLASVGGFYGKSAQASPAMAPPPAPAPADDDADKPDQVSQQMTAQPVLEGSLQDKLTAVRATADAARQAQERSNLALYEGLGAAYDFALDAEDQPEDYLRLVESQGLKIQLRSPMTPVVRLAFAGLTDDDTIGQLEAVLAWALKADLPRGSLAERIQSEGGIGRILAGAKG